MPFPKRDGDTVRLDSNHYNKDYFTPGPKSSYTKPFTWEVEAEGNIKMAQWLKDRFHPQAVLELGCAKGFLLKALLQIGIEGYGCDISKWAVENYEPEAKGRLKVADIRNGLPYPDNSFDLICSLSTLEHIEMEYLPHVASEMARVTKKWVVISIPIVLSNENKPWGDPSHRTYMPASYWISLFYQQGLICDLRTSKQEDENPYHSVTLILSKGGLS